MSVVGGMGKEVPGPINSTYSARIISPVNAYTLTLKPLKMQDAIRIYCFIINFNEFGMHEFNKRRHSSKLL
jgi:hypothetical protein